MSNIACICKGNVKGIVISTYPSSSNQQQCDIVGKQVCHTVELKVLRLIPMEIFIEGEIKHPNPLACFQTPGSSQDSYKWEERITPNPMMAPYKKTFNSANIISRNNGNHQTSETIYTHVNITWKCQRKNDFLNLEFEVAI